MGRRIVILDGFALNPGDLSWAALEELGDLTVHDRTAAGQILSRAAGAVALLTNKTPLDRATLGRLAGLRYVGVLATGYNVVDVAAARELGVVVTNVPGYSSDSVAQHVFALLLELVSQVGAHDRAVHEGAWVASPDFSFTVSRVTELASKTLGIVGMGAIGQRVARIGGAMGMPVAAATRSHRPAVPGVAVRWLGLEELFAEADVLTLHCPLTDQTHHLVNAQRLARMKSGAYLINTSRGPVLDEAAVAAALVEGRLAGVGLDVLSVEPPRAENPLLGAPRCVITPHIAWASVEARRRLMAAAAANLRAFFEGRAANVVNG